MDSLEVVELTVIYTNGSSQSFSNAVMYQDTSGNLFLTNSDFAGTNLKGPNNMPIQSINVTALDGGPFTGLFQDNLQSIVCFAAGTSTRTPTGERPVEVLRADDVVNTLDHGPQTIRWAGARLVPALGRFRPVRIKAGALGPELPDAGLLVSQQHRLLACSQIAKRMFGCAEALIPAKRLVGLPGVRPDGRVGVVSYHHLLFDQHEIVFANGTPSESLLPGRTALGNLENDTLEEVLALFPELADGQGNVVPARKVPPGRQQKQLIARHRKNSQPLLLGFVA